ncbi:MAG: class I SAM-dependent methyltransferase [Desulfobacteraceae bacterium]|nr:class I SAM-dependent methyltransferase [Desulfobacteraceae bacterium]
MGYYSFFSKQARKPSGLFGRFFMSHLFEKGNAELNALVYENLSIRSGDHALEIGFGTGKLIQTIAGQLDKGAIEGIDFSKTMVKIAKKKNRKHLRSGKVRFHLNDFNQASFADNCFDKIFTVNTLYFWQNPKTAISRIHRILKPGGKVVIGFIEKKDLEKMPLSKDVFQYYTLQNVTELLSVHGSMKNTQIFSKKVNSRTCYCAVAEK